MNNHWKLWLWCCTWLQCCDKYFPLWKNIARPFTAVSGWHLGLDLHQKLPLNTECPLLRSCSVLRQSGECHLLLLTYKKLFSICVWNALVLLLPVLELGVSCWTACLSALHLCTGVWRLHRHWRRRMCVPWWGRLQQTTPQQCSVGVRKLMPCIKWQYRHPL